MKKLGIISVLVAVILGIYGSACNRAGSEEDYWSGVLGRQKHYGFSQSRYNETQDKIDSYSRGRIETRNLAFGAAGVAAVLGFMLILIAPKAASDAQARAARHLTRSKKDSSPISGSPEATSFTLSCDELRLFIEFALRRGEFGRIGSSPEMEISLPLMGLAEEECAISLDEAGVLWLIREGKEQPVELEPPAYFRAGPYRFLVREKVEVPATPAPPPAKAGPALAEPPAPAPKRRSPKAAIAVLSVVCLAAAIWFAVQNAKDREVPAAPASTQTALIPQSDPAPKAASAVASEAKPPPSDKAETEAETAKATPSAAPDSPPVAEPKETDTIDLEKLAKVVSPCVFRVEVVDEAGTAIGLGTGFAVSSDGLVATNFHVVEHGAKFALITQQGARFDNAQLVAEDPASDLAVLKIEAKDLPFLKLAASSDVPVGRRVAVFGSPQGLGGTLSEGIISATPRDLKERLPDQLLPNGGVLLQTNAPISQGSSGSPLFDSEGRVIGVMTMILHGASQPQNLNFAVPVEALKPLIPKTGFQWPFFGRQRPKPGDSTAEMKVPDKGSKPSEVAPMADPAYRELRAKIEKQEWVEAMKLAGALVEKYPKAAVIHFDYAYCASALRLDRQAELSYLKVLEILPNDAATWHNLGIAIANQNQTERSLAAFERAVALKPDAAGSWRQIVIGNVVLGNWPKATTALNTLDQVNPAESKELSRFLSRFRLGDAGFRQAVAGNLSKKLGNIAKDGAVRVRVVGVGANDTLSVRSGPGATFSVVTAVANGTEMFVTGRSEVNGTTEWVPVEDGNWSGWVAARFLAPVD
ncbi:trypsin-like peptidase domain-containing protein [Luteolibacter sp. GHJ8]|uniref:Trypsin-like peptidase domain-containing protein n=1 Tax=Luteolibacter rhizosphaerae TaxID=2989719 RepID=A0ABT3G179_9BACT|nr:trypsin-like peptidase domain-containing protein [Luteolibacter rhizosphaerae]MCW1912995.1 trypsin-like peptidase domain-containing protein [Luteolibacter rhizosphaerae]